jgi:hypothetical protein
MTGIVLKTFRQYLWYSFGIDFKLQRAGMSASQNKPRIAVDAKFR